MTVATSRSQFAALLALLAITGCASKPTVQERAAIAGFPAYRITNGTVELVVVPAIGRIMQFGYVGGPNLLWTNPNNPHPATQPTDWANWGGDKTWLWPQDDWEKRTGKNWPPPMDNGLPPYEVHVTGRSIEMRSPTLPLYGGQFVRTIELAEHGATVTLRTLWNADDKSPPATVSAWEITQLHAPNVIAARLANDAASNDVYTLPGMTPWPLRRRVRRVILLNRSSDEGIKAGVDATLLAGLIGDTLLTVERQRNTTDHFDPGERAQLFSNPGNTAEAEPRGSAYVELEFTSPKQTQGHSELVETWTLQKLPPNQQNAEAVVRLLNAHR